MARPVVRPELPPALGEAGPTAVQFCDDSALVGSWTKMRVPTVNWSATGSPSPEPSTELFSVSVQLSSEPTLVEELLWICRVQLPREPAPLKALRGFCGRKVPLIPAAPFTLA